MKLQRMTMTASYPHVGTKDFYPAADVDALLASIREAVDAEREAWCEFWYKPGDGRRGPKRLAWEMSRAALDALLSGEDA